MVNSKRLNAFLKFELLFKYFLCFSESQVTTATTTTKVYSTTQQQTTTTKTYTCVEEELIHDPSIISGIDPEPFVDPEQFETMNGVTFPSNNAIINILLVPGRQIAYTTLRLKNAESNVDQFIVRLVASDDVVLEEYLSRNTEAVRINRIETLKSIQIEILNTTDNTEIHNVLISLKGCLNYTEQTTEATETTTKAETSTSISPPSTSTPTTPSTTISITTTTTVSPSNFQIKFQIKNKQFTGNQCFYLSLRI